MGPNRFITWPMLAGITLMLFVLATELLTHVLGNVAYVAICAFTLWFTSGRRQIILISIFATALLILGYILAITIYDPPDQLTFFVNRVSAAIAIWFAGYFTIRYQNARAEENRQRLEIEERKIAEARLRSSQEMHMAIAMNFPDGWIGILDEDLTYVFADGKGLSRAGVTPKHLIGQKFSKILNKDVEPFLESALKGNHVAFDIEFNGRSFEVNVGPFLSSLKIKRLLVVIHDISIMKETEIRLTKALEKERELSELKSRFVTMASHEFRTPLTTIQSSSTLLGMYPGDAYDKEKVTHVTRIKNSVKLLTEILNDFLSLDKLEKGDLTPRYEVIYLQDFMNQIVQEVDSLKRETQKLVINYDGINDITSDRQFLKNILYNLLSNAFKYSSEDDQVAVEVKVLEDRLTINVIDHGVGIPFEEQEYIFDRFFRAHNVANTHGTGLGLTIVRKYVDLLSGTLSFTSKMGEETKFTLGLPVGFASISENQ